MRHFKYIINSLRNKNTLHVYINNISANSSFPKPVREKVTLFYIFGNLFNVWPKRRQPGSHVCFKIQAVVTSHMIQRLRKWEWKNANDILLLLRESFWACADSLRTLWELLHYAVSLFKGKRRSLHGASMKNWPSHTSLVCCFLCPEHTSLHPQVATSFVWFLF